MSQLRHTASTAHSVYTILRRSAARVVKEYAWIPPVVAILSAAALTVKFAAEAGSWFLIGAGLVLLASVFLSGYSAHARRHAAWAPLTHLERRQYAEVWNSLMDSPQMPRVAVAGVPADEELGPSTSQCLQNLLGFARVGRHDDVLEIGCGTGRIGLQLAPRCRHWTGADISAKMLAAASERLRSLPNIRLTQLQGDLSAFAADSFDVVYATSVLGHLDEMDRWCYIQEAFRVLRPGGRLLADNIDIESETGWTMFLNDVSRYQKLERPAYMPRFSTGSELLNYAERAGFARIELHRRPPLVVLTSTKPPHKETRSNVGHDAQRGRPAALA